MSATAPRINGRAPRVQVASTVQPDAGGLMDALLAISAEVPKLQRTEPGQIQNRTYLYVTLDALLDVVVPLLIKHELVWVTRPTITETGQPALRYRLTHVPSGESEEDVMPLMGAQDSQGVGSALTYARRYALLAVLNLAPGDDDDGAAASTPDSRAPQMREQNRNAGATAPIDRYAQAEAAHAALALAQPQAAPAKPSERAITANQREKLLKPRAQKAGLSDGAFANVILAASGEPPRVWRTEEHAAQTLARLLDRLPARLKDAVLEGIDAAGKASS